MLEDIEIGGVWASFVWRTDRGEWGAGNFATFNRRDAKGVASISGGEKPFALLAHRAVC